MRKLILISVLLLASASAQAAEFRGLVLAGSDSTVASADALPRPLPPVVKSDAKNDSKNDAKTDAKTDEQPPRQQASAPAAPRARPHAQARRYEANEATARRIAARYGISW
jgi:hypothetical protein